MALITCPECGKGISDQSDHCIHCGYPLKSNNDNYNSYNAVVIPSMNGSNGNKIAAINTIRRLTNLSLAEAKELVESHCPIIKDKIPLRQAEMIVDEFQKIGISATVIDSNELCNYKKQVVSQEPENTINENEKSEAHDNMSFYTQQSYSSSGLIAITVLAVFIAIIILVLTGFGGSNGHHSSTNTCPICGRTFEAGDSGGNYKSISTRNMCVNCYNNFKWSQAALGK